MHKDFINILAGMNILKEYSPDSCDISSIPDSFPNGAPNHAKGAYLSVSIENWPASDDDEKTLDSLGWKMEQEGYIWVYIY